MFWLLAVLFASGLYVNANTEIINFSASNEGKAPINPLVAQWPIFDPKHNEQQFQVTPAPLNTPLESICALPDEEDGQICLHELWLALDLDADAWSTYDKFTLRVSWPASSPADFSIQTLTPRATISHLDKTASIEASHDIDNSTTTRRQYARIRLVDTGVRTPSLHPSHPATTSVPAAVPFVVTLEPLYLGVLPASVAPVLAFLVPLIIIASMMISPVHLFLQGLATQARKEVESVAQHTKAE